MLLAKFLRFKKKYHGPLIANFFFRLGDIIPDVDNIHFNKVKDIEDTEEEEKMDLGSDPTHSTTSSSRHRMVIRQDDMDDDDEDFDSFSDIEPELVQLNNRRLSDTEADFLDSAGLVQGTF